MLLYLVVVLIFQFGSAVLLLARAITPKWTFSILDQAKTVLALLSCTLRIKRGQIYEPKCFYFMNHRGWSDFFIDPVTVSKSGHFSLLGRMSVYWALPFGSSYMHLHDQTVFFRRGNSTHDQINAAVDGYFRRVPTGHMVIYPEGTRNPEGVDLPLKTGMIKYAHRRNVPIQVIHVSNKEKVMKEKGGFHAQRGITCDIVYGPVVHPEKFQDEKEFVTAVINAWKETADTLRGPVAEKSIVPLTYWSSTMNLKLAFCTLLGLAAAYFFFTRTMLAVGLSTLWVFGYGFYILSNSYKA
eukprot:TRINITY_DN948_c0_g1_i1.p1 TRINITY_DN948_c0_g1~~TRINITY_DN948_c0_g1_i1.p1  ORF type:complete len:297 (+),score=59.26 TRINITY_DN948_c0_g1_i1:61-951(+)